MLAPLITILMALGLRDVRCHYLPAFVSERAAEYCRSDMGEIVQRCRQYTTDSIVLTEFDCIWLLPVVYYVRDFTPDNMPMSRMFHTVCDSPCRQHIQKISRTNPLGLSI